MPTLPPTNPTPPLAVCTTCPCGCTDGCDCGTNCSTGMVQQSTTPFSTTHLSLSLGYSNLLFQGGTLQYPQFGLGNNILSPNFAYVTPNTGLDGSSQLTFVWSPQQAVWFQANPGGGYTALFGSRFVLTAVYGGYRICDPDSGTTYLFDGATGLLDSTTTPGGQTIQNTISNVGGANRITATTRSFSYLTMMTSCSRPRRRCSTNTTRRAPTAACCNTRR
jgi:hypothetical protein